MGARMPAREAGMLYAAPRSSTAAQPVELFPDELDSLHGERLPPSEARFIRFAANKKIGYCI